MNSSPLRFSALVLSGGLLGGLGFVAADQGPSQTFSQRLACLFVAVAGAILLYFSAHRLRQGVAAQRWPPEALFPLRALVAHPGWTAVTIVFAVLMLASLLAGSRFRFAFWPFFLLLQAQSQVSSALPRSSAPRTSHIDQSTFAALTSNHWGQR